MTGTRKRPFLNDSDSLDAKFEAQRLAFAPLMFQAARSLRTLGVLETLRDRGLDGSSEKDIEDATGLSTYGVRILLEAGLVGGLVVDTENGWVLTKLGYFVLIDPMTRVNMDFVHDVCYKPAFHFEEAVRDGKPAGLHELGGEWETVYEALSELPETVRKSWFAFDHFYSDGVFDRLLPRIFGSRPAKILDIGGNTGKFALTCTAHDDAVEVTIVDLPGQLREALAAAKEAGHAARVHGHPCNILAVDTELPGEPDLIWMSQFLDCFSEAEIVHILKKAAGVMKPDTRLLILETFWDLQRYEAAKFSVVQTSLYFTVVANGNSKMYHSERMRACIEAAGLEVAEVVEDVGISHTLLECRLA